VTLGAHSLRCSKSGQSHNSFQTSTNNTEHKEFALGTHNNYSVDNNGIQIFVTVNTKHRHLYPNLSKFSQVYNNRTHSRKIRFPRGKSAGPWSLLLTTTYCRRNEPVASIRPHVFIVLYLPLSALLTCTALSNWTRKVLTSRCSKLLVTFATQTTHTHTHTQTKHNATSRAGSVKHPLCNIISSLVTITSLQIRDFP
jgi:hypothetical protein